VSCLLDVDLPQAEVEQQCAEHGALLIAIKPLPAGGTHLVCVNALEASAMRAIFAGKLRTVAQPRYPFFKREGR